MQATGLRALEFDRIRDALSRETLTPLGRARALALEPATEPDDVRREPRPDRPRPCRMRPAGGSLAISARRRPAWPRSPCSTSTSSRSSRWHCSRWRGSSSRWTASPARVLRRRAQSRPSSRRSRRGRVVRRRERRDSAGDRAVGRRQRRGESGAARTSATRCAGSARGCASSLEALTRGRDTAKYLQDQIVTDRNGRYVRRRARRASRRDSGHRAWQLGERREPLSRTARTVDAQQRRRRAGRAREGGNPPHPAGADQRVPARGRRAGGDRWTWRPSSTSCTPRRAWRAAWTASPRSWSPMAASSFAARGTRC